MLAPPQASSVAGQVDTLVIFMLVLSALISLGVFVCLVVFAVRYRRRPGNEVGRRVTGTTRIEVAWTLIPLGLAMIPFVWGAKLYLTQAQTPANALEIYVVAKQWMWKVEQPDGQSEIDSL